MTIEAQHHSERACAALNAAVTNHIASTLQDALDLEVSAKKSMAIGSRPAIASKIALGGKEC